MYLQMIHNDVFHHGPLGHPSAASKPTTISCEELMKILETHGFYWGAGGTPHGFLVGPNYPRVAVMDIDPETEEAIATHPSMADKRQKRFTDPQI